MADDITRDFWPACNRGESRRGDERCRIHSPGCDPSCDTDPRMLIHGGANSCRSHSATRLLQRVLPCHWNNVWTKGVQEKCCSGDGLFIPAPSCSTCLIGRKRRVGAVCNQASSTATAGGPKSVLRTPRAASNMTLSPIKTSVRAKGQSGG